MTWIGLAIRFCQMTWAWTGTFHQFYQMTLTWTCHQFSTRLMTWTWTCHRGVVPTLSRITVSWWQLCFYSRELLNNIVKNQNSTFSVATSLFSMIIFFSFLGIRMHTSIWITHMNILQILPVMMYDLITLLKLHFKKISKAWKGTKLQKEHSHSLNHVQAGLEGYITAFINSVLHTFVYRWIYQTFISKKKICGGEVGYDELLDFYHILKYRILKWKNPYPGHKNCLVQKYPNG